MSTQAYDSGVVGNSNNEDEGPPSTTVHDKHITLWQKIYGFFGFRNRYNFPLWFIFGGAMLGFSLARVQYMNINRFAIGAAQGEWYW